MAKKINKKFTPKQVLMMAAIVLILFGAFELNKTKETPSTVTGNWDMSAQVTELGLNQYLVEEIDFDYSDPQIQSIAAQIKSTTSSPYDAIKETARFVYNSIRYDSDVTVNSCYQATAASALVIGKGDCVDMTRLNVAILRAMGIPSRSIGGCLKSNVRCSPVFAVAPGVEPQVTPLTEGDFKKRGFLHEWLEAYDPVRGWLQVEATAGQVYSSDCNQYIVYAYDSNQYDRCVITDASFWQQCQQA